VSTKKKKKTSRELVLETRKNGKILNGCGGREYSEKPPEKGPIMRGKGNWQWEEGLGGRTPQRKKCGVMGEKPGKK